MADIDLHHEVDRLRERLIDMTLHNRLLNYRRSKNRTLDIVDELPDDVFERLVVNGRAFTFLDQPAAALLTAEPDEPSLELPMPTTGNKPRQHSDTKLQTALDEARLDKVLTTMRREARSAIDETGVNLLYLALGMLEWYEADASSTPRLAPLILVPVIFDPLKKPSPPRELKLVHSGDEIISNLSLARLLEKNFSLKLPDFVEGDTPERYFQQVANMPWRDKRWCVRRRALLGFFSFHKIQMYHDLDPENWTDEHAIGVHPVLPRLIQGGEIDGGAPRFLPDYDIDEHEGAKNIVLVDDADSSQHAALCDIAAGNSLVIEGPPGTGKSQTITNAIADALHKKKTVLFVAEKLAALEVVHRKLEKLGLGDLTLSLHSDKGSLAEVYRDISQRMDARFPMPRELQHKRRELEQCQAQLKSYVEAVTHPVGPHDLPLYDVFWRAVNLRGTGIAPLETLDVSPTIGRDAFAAATNDLHVLSRMGKEIGDPREHPWRGFTPKPLTSNQLPDIGRCLERVAAQAQAMHAVLRDLAAIIIAGDAQWIAAVRERDVTDIAATLQLPDAVRTDWCPQMLTADRRATVLALVTQLDEYHRSLTEAAKWTLGPPLQASQAARAILDATDRGELRVVHDITVTQVRTLHTSLSVIEQLLEQASTHAAQAEALGIGPVRHLAEYEQATKRLALLAHPVVVGEHSVTASYFTAQAMTIFTHAQKRHEELLVRRTKLNEAVAMDALPARDRLGELRGVLRQHAGSVMRWLSGEYRAAVREVKRFMQPNRGRWSHQWLPPLEQVDQYLSDRAAFAVEANAVRLLGPAFKGCDTDWTLVQTQLRWAETMRKQGYTFEQSMSRVRAYDQQGEPLRAEILTDLRQRLLAEVKQPLVLQLLQFGDALPPHMLFDEVSRRLRQCTAAITRWQSGCQSLRVEPGTTVIATHHAARAIDRSAALHQQINDSVQYRHLFGAAFEGTAMDVDALRATHDWMGALATMKLPDSAMLWLTEADTPARLARLRELLLALHKSFVAVREARAGLKTWGELSPMFLPLVDDDCVLAPEVVEALRAQLPAVLPWASFCRAVLQLDAHGLLPLGKAVLSGDVPVDRAADVFELTVCERAGEDAVRRSTALSAFTRAGIEDVRQRFQAVDSQVFELNRRSAASSAAEVRPPDGVSSGRVGEYTEMGLIRNEVQKQQRFCKLRDLIRRAGTALQALKPCFMMSPLSVAQYLEPGAIRFDLVIMDEASQIKPEDAIGSILRAKQMIVVGDPKQLPPTSFFERSTDGEERDDEEQTVMDDNESILEVACKAMPGMRRLKWHFRSKHESLIAFSNHYFYDNELVIFPSPSNDAKKLGVYFEHVPDASVKGGRNPVEAELVARAIVEHAMHHPGESLGVGGFNIHQRDLIQDHLDMICSQNPLAREAIERLLSGEDPLFIKNLENLQGDERDVIFISYTYGPEAASGRVMQRFGPLNGKGGWRRLNVLVTRARKRVKVFTSMQPEQIVIGENSSRGVVSMRDYLEYARGGVLPDRGKISDPQPESDFEIAVARVVQQAGYAVRPQVGVAGYFVDLGVYHPDRHGEFVLGIECDGAAYHSARSARDRDRIREAVIRSRGWRLHRVWSTDWFHNRASEERRLADAIGRAMAQASAS
jgi:very-short-patch-repair endonuclease